MALRLSFPASPRIDSHVVQFHRIGYRQEWTCPCAHPNRLIVYRPTQVVLVAGLLDEIGSHARFGRARPIHPVGRTPKCLVRVSVDAAMIRASSCSYKSPSRSALVRPWLHTSSPRCLMRLTTSG